MSLKSEFVSVQEVAKKLGVSEQRVRVLVSNGGIPAEKLGGRWLIRSESLDDARSSHRRPGRPMDPCSAWGYLWLLSDRRPKGLSPSSLSRLKYRRRMDAEELVAKVRKRGRREDFRAHPGVLDRLKNDHRFVLSGLSGLREHSVDLISGGEAEAYVKASDLDELADAYQLVESNRPNVRLRIVDDRCWPFEEGMRIAPAPVVAVDLLESSDPRAKRAGNELLSRSVE